jgi:poly-gamma-glutamate synthesis protein (capsule biosynthesis protein)
MKVNVLGDFYGGGKIGEAIKDTPNQLVDQSLLQAIQSADLSIVNLESPLTDHTKAIAKTGPAIKAHKSVASFLNNTVGVDLVTLANNHILDYGDQGLEDTLDTLDAEGVYHCGAGLNQNEAAQPYIIEQNGEKLAILNFCENEWSTTTTDRPGANPVDEIQNYRQIVAAKQVADYVLVIAHAGHEHYALPSPRVKKLYRFYAEAGASAVVGHHPHCVSGYENYKDAPIFYSLGNFLFHRKGSVNQPWNQGMLLTLEFESELCRFDYTLFDQCNGRLKVESIQNKEELQRKKSIDDLSSIIANDRKLELEFKKWLKSQYRMYSAYLEPHSNRYLQFLQNRKLLPSLWSKRKRIYLQNLIRCEAHRDVVLNLIADENSHS